jgi:hypothetical protein
MVKYVCVAVTCIRENFGQNVSYSDGFLRVRTTFRLRPHRFTSFPGQHSLTVLLFDDFYSVILTEQ